MSGGAGGASPTAEQEQAIARRSEPLLLSAGAGSGKTSVLVERFVRAVLEDGVAPARILAITFTERAAGELRERVRARFLELAQREAARDTEAAFVSTFHGFCARLLRTHPLLAELDPEFTVLDEGVAGGLRERAFAPALGEFLAAEGDRGVDLVAAYGVDQVRGMLAGAYAELRSRGEELPRLPPPRSAAPEDADAVAACALLDSLLVRYGRSYAQLKRDRGAVDFDDLELRARALLESHESVLSAWAERFELLMVDEFQDTNPRQLAVVRALDRGNLFTVGDELQAIYGFRHADVRLFRARREELEAAGGAVDLTGNFRSRPQLIEVVNAVFGERMRERFTPLIARRDPAAHPEPAVELLLTARSGWEASAGLPEQLAAGLPPATTWRQAEARLLAQRVACLVRDGSARAGEVVVLLRAAGDIEVYERALQLQGMHTLAVVGGFWGRLQTRDLLVYLRTLANPLDESALYQTLASPLVGLSSDGLALLARAAREVRGGAWEAARAIADDRSRPNDDGDRLFDPDRLSAPAAPPGGGLSATDRERLGRFCARVQEERRAAPMRSIAELIERALDAAGYREHVLGLEWGERRLANIHKLLRLARRFQSAEGRDLRAFLDHVERLGATGAPEPDAPLDGVEPDAVRLMTIHAAKGLEFPVVCVADLGRAVNARLGRLLVDGDRIGLQLLRLDGEKATPALDYEALAEERRRAQAEEEDRILYVAMTRARERLLLSGAVDFETWPPQRESTPADWLGAVLAGELEGPLHAAGRPVCDLVIVEGEERARVRCLLNAPETLGDVLLVDDPRRPRGRAPDTEQAHEPDTEQAHEPDTGPSREPDAGPVRGPVPEPTAGAVPAPAAGVPAATVAQARPVPGAGAGADMAGVPGGAIATLSYTSLSSLERCGYRYYLERVLGLAEDQAAARGQPEGGGLQARARGTLVHLLLEGLDFAHPQAPSPADVARHARELGVRTSAQGREEIAALIAAACASAPAARLAQARVVHREHPFAFSLGDREPLITGVIDALADEGGGDMLVLDYKSDRVAPDTDLAAVVERDYGLQRLLYALAVLRDGAASVEIVHWFLQRPREPVAARFDAAQRPLLEEELGRRVAAARAAGFEVSRNPHRGLCLTCPGRSGLCSWGERETMREEPGSAAASAPVEPSAG